MVRNGCRRSKQEVTEQREAKSKTEQREQCLSETVVQPEIESYSQKA
jgi:hypothetical protein